ncbi:uncharacterized protein CMU_009840 [Cryptosporidium muris RN66]|uniref:Uncharacterized protein n=1 Tax=Cryptosporidium muris (strain RN66) TaxID=441375 RepID=B6AE51_CRYMR|nr:uncharacterized protein CMU_009840 [Cryptosporidium muris RN66]EEA06492.1 hypothetical protein CMU_009840 [Cryptosporidium muris RN66]|eukprot:XP_002140841.1 hypothetical protein [Cryptosporidium muris RN66]
MGSSNSSPKVSDDKSIVLDCNLYKNETDAVEGGYCEAMNFNLGPYYPPKYTYFTNGLAISAIGDVKMPVTLSYYLSDVNGNSVIIVCGNNGKEVYIVCSQIVSDHVSLNNNNSKIGGCSMIFGIYNEEFILTSGSDPSVALISAKCAYKYSSVQTTLSENILWGIKTNFTPITTSSTVNGNNPSSDSRNPLKKALSSGYNSNSTIYFGNKGRNDKNGIDDNNHKKILNNTSNSAIFNLPSEGTCNNASISFVIPKKMLLNNNETTLLIKDNSDIPLASVKFNSCCARLTNYNEEQFDTSAYPKGWYLWDIFNMTFAWTLTMYYLISSSNLQPLVSVLRANSTKCPSSIRLLDSSNTELQTHWHYRSHFTGIIPYECSLVNFNESCKSPILNINLVQQLDQQFLRFGFIAPPMNILPISMSLFSSGTPFATINFNKDHILIQTTIGNELFEMPNSIHEGNWVIGDLYFVQPPIKYAIKKSINLKSCTNNTSEDCLLTKSNNWIYSKKQTDLLTFAFYQYQTLKFTKKTYKEIKDMYSKVNHSYLYISLNNNIIVNTLSANEKIDRVIIYGRNNEYNLAYWKIKLGMSPSLHPPDSDLQHLENKIMIYNSVGPNYDLYDTNKDNLL